jgi:hypothetical protein
MTKCPTCGCVKTGPAQSPAQEPVAWRWRWRADLRQKKGQGDDWSHTPFKPPYHEPKDLEIEPLYAAPAGCASKAVTSTNPADPNSFNCNWAPEGCDCTDYCKRRSDAVAQTDRGQS